MMEIRARNPHNIWAMIWGVPKSIREENEQENAPTHPLYSNGMSGVLQQNLLVSGLVHLLLSIGKPSTDRKG